ncbi:MAG TPA: 2Fe-2S iron-sulfur cluster binding domain-containing protein, partial [Pseudonocardiaceae bacterium]
RRSTDINRKIGSPPGTTSACTASVSPAPEPVLAPPSKSSCAARGRIVDVPADRTVLHAVRDVLPAVSAGCEQGVCGSCRTTVLAGEPDHRDELLSSADRAAGAMLICVSRASSERLTLDL